MQNSVSSTKVQISSFAHKNSKYDSSNKYCPIWTDTLFLLIFDLNNMQSSNVARFSSSRTFTPMKIRAILEPYLSFIWYWG